VSESGDDSIFAPHQTASAVAAMMIVIDGGIFKNYYRIAMSGEPMMRVILPPDMFMNISSGGILGGGGQ